MACALGLLVAALPAACARSVPPVDGTLAIATPDTARGIVQLVGSMPGAVVLLTPTTGPPGEPIALAGPDTARLRTLAGLEVMVAGSHSAERRAVARGSVAVLVVDRFVVRSADGVPAHDGIVATVGGLFYLVSPDGTRLEAPHLPPALRQLVGARVFLAGPLSGPPAAYGIISR